MKNFFLKSCLAVMMVLCGWLGYKQFLQKRNTPDIHAKNHDEVINEAKTAAQVIARSVDMQGYSKTVTKRKEAILSNGDISKLPISQSVLDSLRLDNLDKSSRLQQASALIGKLEAKNLRATLVIDSLNKKSFLYKDEYASARFTPDSLGGVFDIDWKLKLIRHDYKKRNGFLSPYTYYTDILSPDPRITIGALQSLTIESQRPGRWGIGLQGGYYFSPSQNKLMPAFGLGLSYNIIRF